MKRERAKKKERRKGLGKNKERQNTAKRLKKMKRREEGEKREQKKEDKEKLIPEKGKRTRLEGTNREHALSFKHHVYLDDLHCTLDRMCINGPRHSFVLLRACEEFVAKAYEDGPTAAAS